jgi:sugar phosphate isomerase/epimerase
MQLGLSTYTFTWAIGVPGSLPPRPMDALALLERVAKAGVRLLQVADNIPLCDLPAAELDRIEKRARELEVAIEVGTRGIAPSHLLANLALARRFRSPLLRVVVDTNTHHPSPDEVVDLIRGVIPEFEKANVTLGIENHDRFTAPTIAKIVERIGSKHVGVVLDTVNSFGALEGPQVVLPVLGPLTVNLHVKDFIVERASHMMGFSVGGKPAGQGMLNVPWLLETLRGMGRDPNAIIELWTPPQATIEETVALEDRWAAESVEYMRRYIAR